MFRDFQENTINSDGWFAWFVVIFCGAFVVHEFYSYLLPYYWIRSSVKNGEYERHRMRDTLSTAVAEEIVGNQFSELIYTPHSFHAKRFQGSQGYLNPDDPRVSEFLQLDGFYRHFQQTSQAQGTLQDQSRRREQHDHPLILIVSTNSELNLFILPSFLISLNIIMEFEIIIKKYPLLFKWP
jgi:hypothetical protein